MTALLTDSTTQSHITAWQRDLGAVRRLAPKTLEAYLRDLGQFVAFLSRHTGGLVTETTLRELRPTDIRAFLAARRNSDVGSRSLARALSSLKSFFGFLEREGVLTTEALNTVRTPKVPRSLPKALTVLEAKAAITATAELEETPWIAARDMAVLSLCYGAGLRISEALAITRADLEAETLRVTGKGGKTRLVPLIAPVRQSIATYLESSTFKPAAC